MRQAVFQAAAAVLEVAGLGAARLILPLALPAIRQELQAGELGQSSAPGDASAGGERPSKKQRARDRAAAKAGDVSIFEDAAAAATPAAAGAASARRSLAVQAAALRLLEAALRAGGVALPLEQRAQVG